MHVITYLRKWIFLAVLVGLSSVSLCVYAADTTTSTTNTTSTDTTDSGVSGSTVETLLKEIATNTYDTASLLNNFVGTWLNPDKTPMSGNLQTNFVNVNNALLQNQSVQYNLLPRLNSDLLGPAAVPGIIPQANDLLFSSLVGITYFSPDPRANPSKPNQIDFAYNYIRNASGILTTHRIPSANWTGPDEDKVAYFNFYDSIMAVESFNAFILSDMYAESINGGPFNKSEQALIKQANDPSWLVAIGGEPLGVVLRQMLMYQSESFILLSQILQTEKQLVAAIVMNNTVGILQNAGNEIMLRNKAMGGTAKP